MGIEKILSKTQITKSFLSIGNIRRQVKNGLLDSLYLIPPTITAAALSTGCWGVACFSGFVLMGELAYIYEIKYEDRLARSIAVGIYYYKHLPRK